MNVSEKLKFILKKILLDEDGLLLPEFNIQDLYTPEKNDSVSISKNISVAFLLSLISSSNEENEFYNYIESLKKDKLWSTVVPFFLGGKDLIFSEIEMIYSKNEKFKNELDNLYVNINDKIDKNQVIRLIKKFFFPEGDFDLENIPESVSKLREKRKIQITELNKDPISKPAKELIITSNVLLTLPPESMNLDEIKVSSSILEDIKKVIYEEQLYWYDHPIQIGTPLEGNEIVHGLVNFDKALNYEKKMGRMDQDQKMTFILSVSVSHSGLRKIAGKYLEDEIKKDCHLENLNIYIFTEMECEKLLSEVLLPSFDKLKLSGNKEILYKIFGVDGEYGRHYSFLKAIVSFWNVFIDKNIKGTFKIDLDQIFPEEILSKVTGFSAFEHFMSPLWGAKGIDFDGKKVNLGMIAGALVNESDIKQSLYTPDIKFRNKRDSAENLIFNSSLPQALSTEAEMMTRYSSENTIDGKNNCIQRIHVTGGTNGILVESLNEYRPFTPSFIGRAEDQAYILSVLFDEKENGFLRYVHEDGLIMRHDKESFAGESIEAAKTGKMIGDYIRILFYSYYANGLPWELKNVKNEIDPFTGCFVSRIPLTVVYLRFVLKSIEFFHSEEMVHEGKGEEFIIMGAKRLNDIIDEIHGDENYILNIYENEKKGWNTYYDIIKAMKNLIKEKDEDSLIIQNKAKDIIKNCMINF